MPFTSLKAIPVSREDWALFSWVLDSFWGETRHDPEITASSLSKGIEMLGYIFLSDQSKSVLSMPDSIEAFIRLLKQSPNGRVFNPWWQVDPDNDINDQAPRIRREQLTNYLRDRFGGTSVALIGEALGYRGGHFTGIPMTSERILLKRELRELDDNDALLSIEPRRTSKESVAKNGFAEPTATIVWNTMLKFHFRPAEFVLWNAFPWHPFNPRKGLLSNRAPTPAELDCGTEVLRQFLNLFPCRKILALGRFAAKQIAQVGFTPVQIRHPASGGARKFQGQVTKILGGDRT